MGKRILICGGGTAGHIYPAMSIIEEILDNHKNCNILYVGTEKGMERDIITSLNINFMVIKAAGLIQKGSLFKKIINYFKFIFNLISGFLKSIKILIFFKPDIILGMGGYVCAPVLLSAIFLRKKFALHEQNYIPGRLNKFFSKFCTYFFLSFKETANYLKIPESKIIYSGNPVRKIIREAFSKMKNYKKYGLDDGKFTVTAFGGSLGANKINNTFISLYEIFKDREDMQFLLISGSRFYENLKKENEKINNLKSSLKIFPYVNEMDEIYNITDLIISRSGANTVAEIAYCNIPAILIPYPFAINNHQYFNATFLEKNGKAIIINDNDLNSSKLAEIIFNLERENKKFYNELKYKKINDNFVNGHKIITKYLVGERN
ncbi:MAG: undecaprenyldiphospho-muramoylpentapeptide beta-N-acetylglucosaminyltransferase [Actinobacteria bacterium]|nr:undecaprenyldiphospho-muramoylpentapeptide beta-N-acetylglucosaminyltransferase [Actinomycetota bacterium]